MASDHLDRLLGSRQKARPRSAVRISQRIGLACITVSMLLGALQGRTFAAWISTGMLTLLAEPPDDTADVVYGQLGSFTTNLLNAGGLSENSLWLPTGVAIDRDDNIYVSDNGNSRILFFPAGTTTATRVYGQGGSMTTRIGNNGGLSAESLLFPEKITLDRDGNLYVADRNNNRVLFYPANNTVATRVYGQNGSFTTSHTNGGTLPPTANQLFGPYDVVVDRDGNVYVADNGNHRILFFSGSSITPTRVYGQHGSFDTGVANKNGRSADTLSFPRDLAFDSAGNLYVADFNNHRVLVFAPGSTTAMRVYGQDGDFTTATAGVSPTRLGNPEGLALDRHDNLYIVDSGSDRVLFFPAGSTTATHVYGQDGSFTTGTPNKGGLSEDSLSQPGPAAIGKAGHLFVGDRLNHRVLRFDPPPDTTAPTASPILAPAPNAAGWNKTPVTVSWQWLDDEAGSGIDEDACAESTAFADEGASLTILSSCRDYAGNSADSSYVVSIDTTPPEISAAATTAPNAAGWYQTDVTIVFSCADGLSGIATCPSGELLVAEGTSVQSSPLVALDVAGNTSAPSNVLSVMIDKTAPSVSLVGGPANGASYSSGAVPGPPTCVAADLLSGIAEDCGISGYSTAVGTHTISATAADRAGHRTTRTVAYTVIAQTVTVLGFYEPVDMGGVWNVVKAGATVPLTFEIFDSGTEITDTSAVRPLTALQTLCSGGPEDDVEFVASGQTRLRYNAEAGRFTYNWKTPKKPGCYVVSIATAGGVTLTANFRLK